MNEPLDLPQSIVRNAFSIRILLGSIILQLVIALSSLCIGRSFLKFETRIVVHDIEFDHEVLIYNSLFENWKDFNCSLPELILDIRDQMSVHVQEYNSIQRYCPSS